MHYGNTILVEYLNCYVSQFMDQSSLILRPIHPNMLTCMSGDEIRIKGMITETSYPF